MAGRDCLQMHFNFHFSAAEILWTLTFAAMLVLLVVLLGRDRFRQFPFFTCSIVLIGLNMLAEKMLANRLAPLVSTEVFLVLGDLQVVIALLLAIELARRAFSAAKWPAWVISSLVLLGGATAVIARWGQWPPAKMVFDPTTLGHLRLMQLVAQKGDLFNEVLAVELFVLVAIAGRQFKTGWRSHTQQILAGIATSSAMLIVVRLVWDSVAHNMPRTQEGYNHMLDLQSRLVNANSMVVLAVMLWWIVCLWIDEPGAAAVAASDETNAPEVEEIPDTLIAESADSDAAPEE
jgi:hypothetical protein